MKHSILAVLFIIGACQAQPTVSNVQIPTASLSHGSAQVLFDTSAVLSASACGGQFTPGAACWRLRVNTSACSGGTGGTVFNPDYHAAPSLQYSMAMNLTGLAPSTAYNVCPEVSNDGITWSTGVSAPFTTLPLPAIHPALPAPPAIFVIPASPAIGAGSCGTGSGTCAVGPNCTGPDLQAEINAAVFGDTITIPAGAVCNQTYTLPTAPDAKPFATTDVTTSTSTIHIVAHGFANGQAVRLSSSGCLPGTVVPLDPNGSGFFNCNNTGGLLPGYVYYVVRTDADNFQLSTAPGPGAAMNFGYVPIVATVSGSTITVQPGPYQQAYQYITSTNAFDTTNPFQLSTTGTLPAGLSLNTNYFLLTSCQNVIKCVSQLSLTNGGSAVTITGTGTGTHFITHAGIGTHYVLQWPPANPAYITVRNAGGDAALTPDGVQISTGFAPNMPMLRQDIFYSSGGTVNRTALLTSGILSHNWRFTGIEITTNPTAAAELATTVYPRPHGELLALGQDTGNIIFERDYIHGQGYPDRLGTVGIIWNGLNTAFVNSYFDKLDYWHPVATGFAPTFTSSTITLASGDSWSNRVLHVTTSSNTAVTGVTATNGASTVTSSTSQTIGVGSFTFTVPSGLAFSSGAVMTITSTGSGATMPSLVTAYSGTSLTVSTFQVTGSGTHTDWSIPVLASGQIYIDMAGVLQVLLPQNVTASCTVTGTTCNVSAAFITSMPVNANGQLAGNWLANFTMSGGNITGASSPSFGQADLPSIFGSEGCQFIIAGVGPGPYNFTNNYVSGTGINLHFDDGGNHYALRADYLIKRNYFNTPQSQMQGSATSDNLRYGHRQPIEWKGGKRIQVTGNIFNGTFKEENPRGFAIELTVRNGGTTTDVEFDNNIITNASGGFSMTGAIEGTYPVSYPALRMRAYNNLLYNISTNQHISDVPPALAWMTEAGFAREDTTLDHNTYYSIVGPFPTWNDYTWTVTEGFGSTNNLIWLDTNTTGISFQGGGEEVQGAAGSCAGKTGTTALNCAMVQGPGLPNFTFSNVMIPAGTNTQGAIQTIYTPIITAAQVPTGASAVGWNNAAGGDFRLNYLSPFVSGGATHALDGLSVGANIDQLRDAIGIIDGAHPISITTTAASIVFHAPDLGAACYVAYGTSTDPTTWTRTAADTSASQARTIALTGLTTKTFYNWQTWCSGTAPTVTQGFLTR